MAGKFWSEKTRTVLRRWLAAEEDPAAPPPAAGEPGKWYDGSEIESLSMEQILTEGIAEGRDKVFIIALNDFSTAVGDKWNRLKTKVDLIADNAARRHLERGSLYQAIGDGIYLVTVQVSGGADWRAKVFAMAEDLGRRLVGDRFVSLAAAGVAVAEAEAVLLLDAQGRFDPEAVTRLARDPGRLLPPPESPAGLAEAAGRMVPLDFERRGRPEGRLVATPILQPDEIAVSASATRPERPDSDPDWGASQRRDEELGPWFSNESGDDRPFAVSGDGAERPDAAVPTCGDRRDDRPLWDSAERAERPNRMVSDHCEAPPDAAWVEVAGAKRDSAEWTTCEPHAGAAGDPSLPKAFPPHHSPPPVEWTEQAKPEGGPPSPRLVAIDLAGQAKSAPEWAEIAPMGAKPPGAEPKAAERPSRTNFVMIEAQWRPCWAIGSGRVDAHLCRPVLRDGQMLRVGDDLLRALDGKADRLDYETLLAAVVGLSAAGGRRLGTLILPLTYRTLGVDTEMARILPALAALRALAGMGRLLVEVAEVPQSARSDALARMLAPLRHPAGGVLLRRTLALPQWRSDAVGGLAGIGLDLTGLEEWERDPGHLAASLKRFRAQVDPLPTYAWGLATPREVAAARESGFVLGNGVTLVADLPQPAPGLPIDASTNP